MVESPKRHDPADERIAEIIASLEAELQALDELGLELIAAHLSTLIDMLRKL